MLPFRSLGHANPLFSLPPRRLLHPPITAHSLSNSSRYSRAYTTRPDPPPPESPLEPPPRDDQQSKPNPNGIPNVNAHISIATASALQAVREWSEKLAITVRKHAEDFTVTAKSRFSDAGMQLNKVTGYDAIEELKLRVVNQEKQITEARAAAKAAKVAYEQAVAQRANSQREVNDLLHRKSSWIDHDVSRFTTLVREDHLFEQNELRARAAVDESEGAVEKEFTKLMHTILNRYHEEQVWSDKIRSASTYGQMAALGLNLLVFVLAIIIVEPWKRKRLAQTFEKKVEQMNDQNTLLFNAAVEQMESRFESRMDALEENVRENLQKSISVPPPTTKVEDTQPAIAPKESIVLVWVGQTPVTMDIEKAKYIGSLVGAAAAGWIVHVLIS